MAPGSMDPYFGPGPWTTKLDQVHAPAVMDRPYAPLKEN